MMVLDSTIANVALPTIAGDLGAATSQGTWVITMFAVSNAISIPLTGWLARQYEAVKVFLVSASLFVFCSWLCGVSHSLTMLIIARVAQGAVAGPMIPLAQSLLLQSFALEKTGDGAWIICYGGGHRADIRSDFGWLYLR